MRVFTANARRHAVRGFVIAVGALALAAPSAQAQHIGGHGGGFAHGSASRGGGFHGGHFGRGFGPGPFWGGVGLGVGLGLGAYYYGAPWYPYYPGYVVTEPAPVYDDGVQPVTTPMQPVPPATAMPAPVSPAPPEPVIYPRNGQSAARLDSDRKACASWAGKQPNATADTVYQRAMAACMDARGYTLR